MVNDKGGTMRLGSYSCKLVKGSIAHEAYKSLKISERHRHRYEFNNKYKDAFVKAGLVATGINEEIDLVEIIEIPKHPWFVGVQFHPEYKSTVLNPHPLFIDFINAAIDFKRQNKS
jgi:CTP synthase